MDNLVINLRERSEEEKKGFYLGIIYAMKDARLSMGRMAKEHNQIEREKILRKWEMKTDRINRDFISRTEEVGNG
jgi:hypothetical protein